MKNNLWFLEKFNNLFNGILKLKIENQNYN